MDFQTHLEENPNGMKQRRFIHLLNEMNKTSSAFALCLIENQQTGFHDRNYGLTAAADSTL